MQIELSIYGKKEKIVNLLNSYKHSSFYSYKYYTRVGSYIYTEFIELNLSQHLLAVN